MNRKGPRHAAGCLVAAILLPAICMAEQTPAEPTIAWDAQTLRFLADGGYPRMIRLRDGAILFSCEIAGRSVVRRSDDDGATWSDAVVAAAMPRGAAANPEPLELDDRQVLLFYNERPGDRERPYTIRMARSRDGGRSWSTRRAPLYVADTRFENGCWEPAGVQLPSGEIWLFFANENPYRDSDEQEITLLRSSDRGRTWSEPRTFAFRAGARDGMPVPLLLHSGQLVVAIEDNMIHGRGMFKPVILQADLTEPPEPITGEDPRRWLAAAGIPPKAYAGAPYLRQLPSGHTILSCQSDEGRSGVQMVVYVGDERARDFAGRSIPMPLPDGVQGQWNALFVKDQRTVTALSGTTIDGRAGVWAIDGRLVTAAPERR